MPEIVFLNGRFMPITEAMVSVNDRGYQFGDGVYEVVRSYNGRLWALERHIVRLGRSLTAIDIHGFEIDEARSNIIEAYEKSKLSNAIVYLQITRGVAPREHAYTPDLEPTILITVREFPTQSPTFFEEGVRTITLPETRWARRDIKSLNLLPNILAQQQAKKHGAYEAIFFEEVGSATEGAHSSLFIVKNGRLITREKGHHILPGITRDLIIEMAREEGIEVQESPFTLEELMSADEVFLTGTGTEALGVVEIDDQPIGLGKVGPITKKLRMVFLRHVEEGIDY